MYLRIAVALTTFLFSTTALAWAVPIHRATVSSTPTPVGDPIPCTYTNADGQQFSGVVTTGGGHVFCTGMVAPTDDDETNAASIDDLFYSLDEDPEDAPACSIDESEEGEVLECSMEMEMEEGPKGYSPWEG